MVYFITVLRALAACLITNSHYTGVYPIDALANGGFIGNAVFMAVSGYCLCNIKTPFPQWYGKRAIRCYLPVWVITAVYLLLGAYTLEPNGILWWFLYPTQYHFIASILLLYIPFYLVLRWRPLKTRLPLVMAGIAGAFLVYYLLIFDKSVYQIDGVRSLGYRVALFETMLLGAWYRQNDSRFRDRFSWWTVPMTLFFFAAYMVLKYLLPKQPMLSPFQILSPISLFALTYTLFRLFAGLDKKLQALPGAIRFCIDRVARMTLEIYVVQNVLIDAIRPLFGFPLNWLALTASILTAAIVLHYTCQGILKLWELTVRKRRPL